MPDPSYFREKAEQARRLARTSADPVLQFSLRKFADEYTTRRTSLMTS